MIDGTERVVRLPCSDDPASLGVQDFVILAVKAHDIAPLVDAMQALLATHTTIVTASNGLPYWYFHGNVPFSGTTLTSVDPGARQWNRLGPDRAIGCVVFPAAELIEPGVIRHEHGKRFPIGEPGGGRSERIEQLHALMSGAGLEAPIRDDIRDEIWLKLCGNVCFNPISALTQATLDRIVTDPGTRAICRAMMLETRDVGEKVGARLRVDLERRLDGAAAVGAHKMSMLQDLERGRSMEIEPLVGVVAELGRITGTPTPTIDLVLALVRQRAQAESHLRNPPLH
jgi:2-dehydropantoate 2-reductase